MRKTNNENKTVVNPSGEGAVGEQRGGLGERCLDPGALIKFSVSSV